MCSRRHCRDLRQIIKEHIEHLFLHDAYAATGKSVRRRGEIVRQRLRWRARQRFASGASR